MRTMLVVDDEAQIRNLVKKYAEFDGFEVIEAEDGLDAVDTVMDRDIDIIIMDLMMPEMNGFDASRLIRKETKAPIIMLTARDSEFDKFQGFELGIDDYVTKPFSPRELMYRVTAILKRVHGLGPTDMFHYQDFELNFSGRSLKIQGELIDLAPKEYELLVTLIKNRGVAMERDQILNKVWGFDFDGDDRTLDTHIKRLRRKMGSYQDLIVTLRGVGYRFDEKE